MFFTDGIFQRQKELEELKERMKQQQKAKPSTPQPHPSTLDELRRDAKYQDGEQKERSRTTLKVREVDRVRESDIRARENENRTREGEARVRQDGSRSREIETRRGGKRARSMDEKEESSFRDVMSRQRPSSREETHKLETRRSESGRSSRKMMMD